MADYRILVIDDDRELCTLIRQSVLPEQIEADCCYSGKSGLQKLREKDYQLVILDVMMPGFDGFETLEMIRKESSLPILMLTAKNDSASKVRGLRAGADNYLTKPFDKAELLARIQAVVRRSKGHSNSIIRTGDVEVNLDTQTVTVGTKTLHLTGKEYGIMELLSLRKGSTLNKDQFLNHLYGGIDEPELKIIDVFICKLRKKLEKASGGKNYIETVWGRGYILKDPDEKK